MNWWRLALFLLAVLPRSAYPAEKIALTEWLDAAQDSTGLVWGVPLRGASSVFVHDGLEWKQVPWSPASGGESVRPVAIASGPDGMVRMIWRGSDGETHWLSQHRGSNSAVVAQFSAKFETPEFLEPFVFVDSKANVWITHKGPSILRASENGVVQEVYSIPKEHLLNEEHGEGRKSFFEAPQVLEDGRGHLWFWMDGRSNNVVRLDSFIEFDGSNFIHRTFSPIPSDARCYILVPEDKDHLLANFRGQGLYRLDLSSFTATEIEEPAPRAFHDIRQIFRSNDAEYIVAPNFRSRSEGNILWRWRPGQQAQNVATGLGRVPSRSVPWLQLSGGLIVGAPGLGLVFVPPNGEPQTLDWASKVGARVPKRLFRTLNNNLLIVAGRNGSDTAPLPPWSAPVRSSAFEELNTKRGYARDSRGHVWAIDYSKRELQEWDGSQWFPRPDSFENKWFESLAVDNHDRVWIIGRDHGPYVWDQSTNRWQVWPNTHEAVEKYLAEDARFVLGPHSSWHMASSGDGRAILRQGTAGSAEYFDGKTWRMWRGHELGHGLPRFDREGRLFIVGVDQAWQLQGENWISGADASQLMVPKVAWDTSESEIGRTKQGQAILSDQNGDRWFTADRRLYRSCAGIETPIFKDGEANPFLDGRGLMDVVIDCNGNVFLKTNSSAQNWIFLRAGSLPR